MSILKLLKKLGPNTFGIKYIGKALMYGLARCAVAVSPHYKNHVVCVKYFRRGYFIFFKNLLVALYRALAPNVGAKRVFGKYLCATH